MTNDEQMNPIVGQMASMSPVQKNINQPCVTNFQHDYKPCREISGCKGTPYYQHNQQQIYSQSIDNTRPYFQNQNIYSPRKENIYCPTTPFYPNPVNVQSFQYQPENYAISNPEAYAFTACFPENSIPNNYEPCRKHSPCRNLPNCQYIQNCPPSNLPQYQGSPSFQPREHSCEQNNYDVCYQDVYECQRPHERKHQPSRKYICLCKQCENEKSSPRLHHCNQEPYESCTMESRHYKPEHHESPHFSDPCYHQPYQIETHKPQYTHQQEYETRKKRKGCCRSHSYSSRAHDKYPNYCEAQYKPCQKHSRCRYMPTCLKNYKPCITHSQCCGLPYCQNLPPIKTRMRRKKSACLLSKKRKQKFSGLAQDQDKLCCKRHAKHCTPRSESQINYKTCQDHPNCHDLSYCVPVKIKPCKKHTECVGQPSCLYKQLFPQQQSYPSSPTDTYSPNSPCRLQFCSNPPEDYNPCTNHVECIGYPYCQKGSWQNNTMSCSNLLQHHPRRDDYLTGNSTSRLKRSRFSRIGDKFSKLRGGLDVYTGSSEDVDTRYVLDQLSKSEDYLEELLVTKDLEKTKL